MTERSLSVHDNLLVAYSVDLEKREIQFRTKFPSEPPEFTDVTFTGVDCYSFEHDSTCGTIIFDFVETSPLKVYEDNVAELIAGIPYGWPGDWAKSREAAFQFFMKKEIKAWRLESSLGMTGWILAREMVKTQSNPTVELPTK